MPDPIAPEGGAPASPAAPPASPAVPPTASAAAPAQPAPVVPSAPKELDADADAVEKRVAAEAERASAKARADLLQSLGAKDIDEARAALKRYQEAEEAQKSELQKLVEAKTKLEAEAKLGASYRDRLGQMVGQQIAALTPEQKAAVERLAGNDPLKIADALEVLRPTWAVSAPVVPAAPQVAPAAPPAPAPASAALPAGAPPPSAQKNKYQEYEELRLKNPMLAPYYYASHRTEIEAQRPPAPTN